MFKTIFFGIIVNVLILTAMSILVYATWLDVFLTQNFGSGYQSMFIFCFVWGMGGAFISLLMSKMIAKKFNGVQVMDEKGEYGDLVRRVYQIAKKAGMTTMPEVGVYQSSSINAFATGPNKNNSLVAVSTGLLQQMSEDEVDGVLAHEVAHIVNGDMVTMTFVQGIVNALVMFIAHIVSAIISQMMRGDDRERSRGGFFGGGMMHYFIHNLIFQATSFLAYPVIAYISRWREFRADAGSAEIVGKQKMIAALEKLKTAYPSLPKMETTAATRSISSKNGFMKLFSTHPPLDDRIAALLGGQY